MRRFFSLALISLLAAGCASQYVVVLTNGHRLNAAEKPRLEKAGASQFNFVFTDLNGQTNAVPSTNVRAIVPASDLKNESGN